MSDEPAEPAEQTDPAEQAEPAEHEETGLELARAINRSLASASAAARRTRSGPGPRRRPSLGDRRRGGLSGPGPDDHDPQLLGNTLDRLVADRGWELDLRVQAVFGQWPALVGAEVAAHTTPETFADGRLVVRTDSTAWATQLRLLAPTVLRRLNEELGHGTVSLLDIQGPHGPSWKKGRLSSRDGRGPRDTYG